MEACWVWFQLYDPELVVFGSSCCLVLDVQPDNYSLIIVVKKTRSHSSIAMVFHFLVLIPASAVCSL